MPRPAIRIPHLVLALVAAADALTWEAGPGLGLALLLLLLGAVLLWRTGAWRRLGRWRSMALPPAADGLAATADAGTDDASDAGTSDAGIADVPASGVEAVDARADAAVAPQAPPSPWPLHLGVLGLLWSVGAGVWDQGIIPLLLGLGSLLLLALASRGDARGAPGDALAWLGALWGAAWRLPVRLVGDAQRRIPQPPAATSGLRIWWLPLGFGSLFAGLFLLANPVLAQWIALGWAWAVAHLTLPTPLRILLWAALFLGFWGLLRSRLPRRRQAAGPAWTPHRDRTALVRRSLLVFHALFLLQNGMDLLYLWGGTLLPEGMTYAEYAHRGAYPLVATALLAAVFILAWFRPGSPVQGDGWCRSLVLAWLVQNLVLLVGALWRLHLYVDVYGLSRWRLGAAVWMALVAVGLLLIAWRIRRDLANRWLVNANLASLGLALAALAWLDADGIIADHNAAHQDPASVDVPYLRELGPAALHALDGLALKGRPDAAAAAQAVRRELAVRLADWRSWTVRAAAWRGAADVRTGMPGPL